MEPSNTRTLEHTLTPVVRELPADLDTPVSVYLKLAGQGPSFLLESVTGGEQVARYSFIGVDTRTAYVCEAGRLYEITSGRRRGLPLEDGEDVLDCLRKILAQYRPVRVPGLPRFCGGLVGYLGYELAREFEPGLTLPPLEDVPEAIFLLADTLVAFDHAYGKVLLLTHTSESEAVGQAEARLDALEARLREPLPPRAAPAAGIPSALNPETPPGEFQAAVRRAKEYIEAGDVFQVVLSQRFSRQTSTEPFEVYRALRRVNPSPYMFYFDFAGLNGKVPFHLIGASPEMHVRYEEGRAALRPIAGTRRRGLSPSEDRTLEADLLSDPKERAEHVMLVDLARNDLGRVCTYGSVAVTELMAVERYSHVMHIVSQVEGELRPGLDAFDLMRATFPAGTVTGAPKIRAMEIIAELEPGPRGPYAGAVGYFSFDGSMDTCITIRTLVVQGDTVTVQSGAGVVADSDPAREYEETLKKAGALAEAVEITTQVHRPGVEVKR